MATAWSPAREMPARATRRLWSAPRTLRSFSRQRPLGADHIGQGGNRHLLAPHVETDGITHEVVVTLRAARPERDVELSEATGQVPHRSPAQRGPALRFGDLRAQALLRVLVVFRLHGLIERVPHTHRYRVPPFGLKVAMFFTRTYPRLHRQGLALALALAFDPDAIPTPLRSQFDRLDTAIDKFIGESDLAA